MIELTIFLFFIIITMNFLKNHIFLSLLFLFIFLPKKISAQQSEIISLAQEIDKKGKIQYALKNEKGKTIKNLSKYDQVFAYNIRKDRFLVCKKINEKSFFGLINEKGKEIIKCEYETIQKDFALQGESFLRSGALILLKKNQKIGAFDTQGKLFLPFEYDSISVLYQYGDGFPDDARGIWVKKNQKWDIIDLQTKQPKNLLFDDFLGFWKTFYYTVEQYGIFLKEGKIVFFDFNTQKIAQNITDNENHILTNEVKHNQKTGLIDRMGNILIPFEYTQIKNLCADKYNAFKVQKNEKWGLFQIDKTQKFVLTKNIQFEEKELKCE